MGQDRRTQFKCQLIHKKPPGQARRLMVTQKSEMTLPSDTNGRLSNTAEHDGKGGVCSIVGVWDPPTVNIPIPYNRTPSVNLHSVINMGIYRSMSLSQLDSSSLSHHTDGVNLHSVINMGYIGRDLILGRRCTQH